MDFREVLVWREDSPLKRRVAEIARGLQCDEVMNLQFTRYAEVGTNVQWSMNSRWD